MADVATMTPKMAEIENLLNMTYKIENKIQLNRKTPVEPNG